MFDIFISFKHSDDGGKDTFDLVMASKLNQELRRIGYSVFFSEASLMESGSSEYKKKIDDALDEAKVLVVVTTSREHCDARWVRYEWESFYNDYLSGIKKDAKLFTLTKGVNIHDLPRTLRNVQNFDYDKEFNKLLSFIGSSLGTPERKHGEQVLSSEDYKEITETKLVNNFYLMRPDEITPKDIQEVLDLESEVYNESGQQDLDLCLKFFAVNPNIYLFFKDLNTGKIIANIDISPISDECYEKMRSGHLLDKNITPDMVLSYDMPSLYNIYFSSIVIHKNYRNTNLFLFMFNSVVEMFIQLGQREILARRMIADAVTQEGERFCKLFGMKKVKESDHESTLYEVSLIPPEFKPTSRPTKELYDYYKQKYEENKDFIDCL